MKDHWQLILILITGPIGLAVVLVMGHFDAIKKIVIGVFDWVKDHWKLILVVITGPIGLAVLLVTSHFDAIKKIIGDVVSWIGTYVVGGIKLYIGLVVGAFQWVSTTVGQVYTDVTGWLGKIVGFVAGLPGKITSAASGMWNSFSAGFKGVINTIIGWWDGLKFSIPSFSIGPISTPGFTLQVPQIPYLAAGGIVTRATTAVIGEAGPEAVIPLSKMSSMGGTTNVNITGQGIFIGTKQELAAALVQLLQQAKGGGMNLGLA